MLLIKSYAVINDDSEFKYLIKMPMDSVSEENVDKLNKEHKDKSDELQLIKETTEQQMWRKELEILAQEYIIYKEERQRLTNGTESKKKKIKGTTIIKKSVKSKQIIIEDDAQNIIINI